jgi:formamidopyrimidine-DNA glycosylase
MPELPEVQTVVTTLRPKLLGRTIRAVRLARADILQPAGADLPALLVGRAVSSIERRGKRIIFRLDDDARFYVHLGMTGQLTVAPPDAPLLTHTHLTIDFDAPAGAGFRAGASESRQIRFRDPRRFGGVWWLGHDAAPDAGMGPEPLSLRPAQLARQLARTTRAVKNALLDQSVVAGLGNIYVDESLFTARIHPLAPADRLSPEQVARLNRAIKATLRKAIRHRGSTLRDYMDADGASGGFQSLHRVYDRAGEPCRSCRTPVERIVLGGRSTHFCPRCQPAVTPSR